MPTHIKQNNCPCGKGEYCTNGLKCTEQNCFLLKSSTVVPKPLAIPIAILNPILILPDNGGRRSCIERRELWYTTHILEQRSCKDERRIGKDRRSVLDRRIIRKTSK